MGINRDCILLLSKEGDLGIYNNYRVISPKDVAVEVYNQLFLNLI